MSNAAPMPARLAPIAALLLAACSRPPAATGPTRITYWEKWTGFEGDAMRAVVDQFNATQSRIHVDLLTVSQVDQKMLLATPLAATRLTCRSRRPGCGPSYTWH